MGMYTETLSIQCKRLKMREILSAVSYRSMAERECSTTGTLAHLALIVSLLFAGAIDSLAKCTVCVTSTGKCYTFTQYSCKEMRANLNEKVNAQVSCEDGLTTVTGTNGRKGGSGTAAGISVPVVAEAQATKVLHQAGIAVIGATASGEPGRILVIVDESTLNAASEVLRRSAIAFKPESVPQEPVQPEASRAVSTKGISGSKSAPPPAPAAAAGVVNSSRSNIKNNLAVNDPAVLNVTGVACNGTKSVSATTNHAVPAGAAYVITSAAKKTTYFPADTTTRDANGQLQIPFDASSGVYTLDIQNANGISILPKPLPVINCAPR